MTSSSKPRIGISACLLGEPVRFDGGHKRDTFLVDTFGRHVEWVPVCPEIEIGLGVPRPTLRLKLSDSRRRPRGGHVAVEQLALVVPKTGENLTVRMRSYAERRADEIARQRLSGFILKKDSPSCGMERVKVYKAGDGPAEPVGRGIFAAALIATLPNLPIEEEGRLGDARLRDNFIERVFAYQRLRTLFESRWTYTDLVRFHTIHKLTLMAHSPSAYRTLGQLVATSRRLARPKVEADYESAFMRALSALATPKRHANVLEHVLGFFKKTLDTGSRTELLALIDEHRRGQVPLIVPMTLIRHHVRHLKVEYLGQQSYLDPHPRELSLRSHV